jgi:hypothetical protein
MLTIPQTWPMPNTKVCPFFSSADSITSSPGHETMVKVKMPLCLSTTPQGRRWGVKTSGKLPPFDCWEESPPVSIKHPRCSAHGGEEKNSNTRAGIWTLVVHSEARYFTDHAIMLKCWVKANFGGFYDDIHRRRSVYVGKETEQTNLQTTWPARPAHLSCRV